MVEVAIINLHRTILKTGAFDNQRPRFFLPIFYCFGF